MSKITKSISIIYLFLYFIQKRDAFITETAKLEQRLFDTGMNLRIPMKKLDAAMSELSSDYGHMVNDNYLVHKCEH